MRFSLQLPTDQVQAGTEFLGAESLARMARTAEQAGFDACFVTDHPIPDDRWLRHGGHHTLDPFVALSFAAAATRRIRLQTHVLVLAYRNPFLTAKAAATLDVLSGGRLILGVAAGYLESEFAALGVSFDERNELNDEAIRVLKQVWTGTGIEVEGRHFSARGNTALPHPVQKPHPPIWVGGNSRRAIRRAVELGDGWLPFPAPAKLAGHTRTAALENIDDLTARISYAREHAETVGRSRPLDICFMPFGFEMFGERELDASRFRETVAELDALGVTWLTLSLPGQGLDDFCDRVEAFGSKVLAKPSG